MLAGTQDSVVPALLHDNFQVKICSNLSFVETGIASFDPDCVFFDFDYPDRKRLTRFSDVKSRYPSIPMVLITLQHSESLAVWTYRHGALEYLVKPVPTDELRTCIDRILDISGVRATQARRGVRLRKVSNLQAFPSSSRSTKDKLAPAIFFVQQNYSQRIYSDAIARLCGLSATYFSRAFKQTFELTFQEFLLRYRVYRACELLDNENVNISEVSYAVGFTDPSYFTRVFRRYIGMAPSAYSQTGEKSTFTMTMTETTDSLTTSCSQVVRALAESIPA
jgi:AraC-like DNA-binding protein